MPSATLESALAWPNSMAIPTPAADPSAFSIPTVLGIRLVIAASVLTPVRELVARMPYAM